MRILVTLMWKDLRESKTTFFLLISGSILIQCLAYFVGEIGVVLSFFGFIPAFQLPANIARSLKSNLQTHRFYLLFPLIKHRALIGLSIFVVHLLIGLIIYVIYFSGLTLKAVQLGDELQVPILDSLKRNISLGDIVIWHISGLVYWLGITTGLPLIRLSFNRRGSLYAVLGTVAVIAGGIILVIIFKDIGISRWAISGLSLGIFTLLVGLFTFEKYSEL